VAWEVDRPKEKVKYPVFPERNTTLFATKQMSYQISEFEFYSRIKS
jgi:hypothetical protein